MRIKVAGLVAALFCVSGLAVYGTAGAASPKVDSSKPPVRLALVSIKVPFVDILTTYQTGVGAAVKQINARGGFGGRRVVFDSCNSKLDNAVARVCAQKLIAKKPVAMIGCDLVWSAAGQPVFKAAGVSSWGCKNTPSDLTDSSSFGTNTGAFGEQRGFARYLCTRSDVKKVVMLDQDLPQQRKDAPTAMRPTLKNCGKTVDFVWYPVTAADLTPYINKVAQLKPDFVTSQGGPAATIQMAKGLKQAGIPASKFQGSSSSFDYDTGVKPGGADLEGAYAAFEVASWSDTSNPDVVSYLKAVKATGKDGRASVAGMAYANVMYYYEVAKKVGFDKFNASTLQKFMNSKASKGMHLPLGKTISSPGPANYPAIRHPWVQIVQVKNGKMQVVKKGTDRGWVNGF